MTKKLNIFQQARELSGWHAIAFSATLLERMLPNYELFCEVTEFADSSQHRNTLNSIWESLSSPKSKINFSVQLDKVEELIPDAADFDHFGVYPAIDAAMALTATLMLIMGDDENGAVVVSKLSQGSVEAAIDALYQDDEEDSRNHPLMVWEREFQQALLQKLTSIKPSKDSALMLKQMALEEGMSNIGLEL